MRYVDTELENVDDAQLNKHRKKKPSSVSKSALKSKHKHEYGMCILISADGTWHRAEYCIHCGKIHNVFLFETKKIENGFFKQLSQDEVKRAWKDLPKYHVQDIWDKVVNFEE